MRQRGLGKLQEHSWGRTTDRSPTEEQTHSTTHSLGSFQHLPSNGKH